MSDDDKPKPGGGFTLDGKPVDDTLPANWGRPERREGRIGDWGGGDSGPSSGHASPSAQDKKEGAEFYTGGERSGLAVQNPDHLGRRGGGGGGGGAVVDDILRQAASRGPATDPEAPRQRSNWGGVGHTLGSDEVDSVQVGDAEDEGGEAAQRTLTFWCDGFSIEDGELHRYDTPGNRELLEAIHNGRAPMSLFNVGFDQPLEIVVRQRTNEDYRPPPKMFRSFEGQGNRLGSVTPEISGASTPIGGARGSKSASPAPTGAAAAAAPAALNVDPAKPAANVQIRLGDGSRVVARVNLDHTVGDLRNYINATHPDPREYILQTTFPVRELPDSETIADAKLANAVVIQRFK